MIDANDPTIRELESLGCTLACHGYLRRGRWAVSVMASVKTRRLNFQGRARDGNITAALADLAAQIPAIRGQIFGSAKGGV